MMEIILSPYLWMGVTALFFILTFVMGIVYFLMITKTHLIVELKAWMTGTPIGVFFQDNKFAEWKPITPVNGVIYDEKYGPFVATSTYVDKKTKNIIIPFDVDMDGDRTSNLKDLVMTFKGVTNNQRSISDLRLAITTEEIEASADEQQAIKNMTSYIKISSLKALFVNNVPHNVKSKIEKLVSKKIKSSSNVNPMQAVLVFGAIFGIIVIAAIILKSTGGV